MANSPEYVRSPRNRFNCHRTSARHRGIAFELTFEQWWSLWEPYWHLRGKDPEQYCMARKQDRGAYALDNVEVKLVRANRAEQPQVRGSLVGNAKLTEHEIPRIRDMLRIGVRQRDIACWFGVGQPAVKDINLGITWRHA